MSMARDDDLIRSLLMEYEKGDSIYVTAVLSMNQPFDEVRRHQHAELLCDAGYFEAINKGVYRMTNQGFDYLEVIKSDEIWSKTKGVAASLGGVTLGMMKDIAVAYIKQKAAEHLKLPL